MLAVARVELLSNGGAGRRARVRRELSIIRRLQRKPKLDEGLVTVVLVRWVPD